MSPCLHSWNRSAKQASIATYADGVKALMHECQYCRKCQQKRCVERDEDGVIVHVSIDAGWKEEDMIINGDVQQSEVTG